LTRGSGSWGPRSNGWMIEAAVLAEIPATDRGVPTFEIPSWREELGIVAGVTGRGVEAEDFDLGLASDQPTRVVIDRWLRVQRAFAPFPGIVIGRQVHGTDLRWHDHGGGWSIFPGVDGHASAERGILLTVSVADCIPVYVVDPATSAPTS
jgi:copper oxidase (laccase) domain-containing protein